MFWVVLVGWLCLSVYQFYLIARLNRLRIRAAGRELNMCSILNNLNDRLAVLEIERKRGSD